MHWNDLSQLQILSVSEGQANIPVVPCISPVYERSRLFPDVSPAFERIPPEFTSQVHEICMDVSGLSRRTVRAYLIGTADTEPTYLRARDIADDLDASLKAVAQYLSQLQNDLADVSLEQWGRSKSTTWRLEVNES